MSCPVFGSRTQTIYDIRCSKIPIVDVSSFVTRLYQSEGVTPEISAVSEFIVSILGEDCAGEKDLTFLTLRVGVQCD